MERYLWFIALLVFCNHTFAQKHIFVVDEHFEQSDLHRYAVYLADSSRRMDVSQVVEAIDKGLGKVPEYAVPNLGFAESNHWIQIELYNRSNVPVDLVFELDFSYTYLDEVGFFLIEGKRVLKSVENLSWFASKTTLELPDPHPCFPILLQPGKKCKALLRLWKEDGVLITPLLLHSKATFLKRTQSRQIMIGLVSGMQVLAILVGSCFFLLTRQFLYLYYSLYVIGITGFILADQGQLNVFFVEVYPVLAGPSSWAFFALFAVASHTFFTIKFLKIQKTQYPVLIYTSWLLNVASLLFSLMIGLGYQLTDLTYQIAVVIVLIYVVLVFVYLIIGLRSGQTEAYLYLGAVSTFFFTIIMICLAKLDFIPEYQFVINMLHNAPLLEVTILCMGLVYIFYQTQNDKIAALSEVTSLRTNVAKSVIETQETERHRISQDLHDDVGNTLAAAKGLVGTVLAKMSGGSAGQACRQAYALIDKAGVDLRSITHNLMPVDFGKYKLTEILKQTVEQLNEASDIYFQYLEQGHPRRIGAERELMIYRIVGELTSNVLKHSSAENSIIQVLFQDENLVISVEDDGKGNSGEKNNQEETGIGLKNVTSRAMYIHAKLSVDIHQNGTCVILEVPYE